MRCLLLGSEGQVGTALRGCSEVEWVCADRPALELSDPTTLDACFAGEPVHAVLNAAAWTDVDAAEAHADAVHRVNAAAVGHIAARCAELGVPLVHLSTAYVFDGTAREPYKPADPTNPVTVYGASKLAGERAIRASGCDHVIVRTCAVFSATHPNFVAAILRASRSRDALDVVGDQVVGPTSARHLAADLVSVLQQAVQAPMRHTTHLTGGPDVSYAELARHVVSVSGGTCSVRTIDSSQWPSAAERPANARLCPLDAEHSLGLRRHDWRPEVARVVWELSR